MKKSRVILKKNSEFYPFYLKEAEYITIVTKDNKDSKVEKKSIKYNCVRIQSVYFASGIHTLHRKMSLIYE
jgi:hypothetical protein